MEVLQKYLSLFGFHTYEKYTRKLHSEILHRDRNDQRQDVSLGSEIKLCDRLEGIKKRFLRLVADKSSNLEELLDGQQKIGISGEYERVESSTKKLKNYGQIGENSCIQSISELNARHFSRILILNYQKGEHESIIFKLPQQFTLRIQSNDLEQFVKNWQVQIIEQSDRFLLNYIHKFTLKIAYFDESFWVTVNEPVFDITTCYDWAELGKDVSKDEDLQTISYFLRCCYVKEFIKFILRKHNMGHAQIIKILNEKPIRKEKARLSHGEQLSSQSQDLPQKPFLHRSYSEGSFSCKRKTCLP